MRNLLVLLCLLLSAGIYSQQLHFPASSYADSNQYSAAFRALAEKTIPLYTNPDKRNYYDGMFRLNFAKQDYPAVINYLDSVDLVSGLEKNQYKVIGIHYRVYVMIDKAFKNGSTNSFEKEFQNAFYSLYTTFPEDARDQTRIYFTRDNFAADKKAFADLLAKQRSSGSDSISLANAVALIRSYNLVTVYDKTLAIARKEFKAIDAYELANRENKLLGLDEGAILSPTAKTFITNVTVIDVEKQSLISNATVGITGSVITSISNKPKLPLAADATVIDGSGQFLLPGMTDAHIHFFQSGGLYARPDAIDLRKHQPYEKEIEWNRLNMKDVLKRNIQNGITSVIDVGATYNFLQLRDKFRGKSFAPAVYMTGPLLTTYEPPVFKDLGNDEPFNLVKTAEEARQVVKNQLAYHPDLIKIWYILDNTLGKETSARNYAPIIKAIIDEAHKNNVKVAVHATERIAAQLAIENGCDYLVHSVEDEIVSDEFLRLMKTKNVTLCPTLVVYDGYAKTFGQEHAFSLHEFKRSNPVQLSSLSDLKHLPETNMIEMYKNSVRNNRAIYRKQDSICLANLKKMVDFGVRIAAGTDAGNIGTLHATSYLNELLAMKKAGINNWQVLQSATINPAFIVGKENETGSIAVGKKADLVLLKANPVDNLQNLEQISLVINKGHVIKPDTLIKETALALVQRQLNAYNARNLEAFLEPYAEDVEVYTFPEQLQYKGKEEMRKQYAFFKTVPDLHCEVTERIIHGNTIIDKESVVAGGGRPREATAIYQIENNKIKRVYFLR